MMRAALLTSLALAIALLSGCASCDPNESVPIRLSADPGLNPYDGGPHKMDVYFFYLSVPGQFQGAPVDQLTGTNPTIAAGTFAGRKNVSPGEQTVHTLGPRALESYTHVGILARYYQNSQRAIAPIPNDCKLKLRLGARSIESFTSD